MLLIFIKFDSNLLIVGVRFFRKHRGLGDTVAAAAQLVGVKKSEDCGCSERQELLNKIIPYANSEAPAGPSIRSNPEQRGSHLQSGGPEDDGADGHHNKPGLH